MNKPNYKIIFIKDVIFSAYLAMPRLNFYIFAWGSWHENFASSHCQSQGYETILDHIQSIQFEVKWYQNPEDSIKFIFHIFTWDYSPLYIPRRLEGNSVIYASFYAINKSAISIYCVAGQPKILDFQVVIYILYWLANKIRKKKKSSELQGLVYFGRTIYCIIIRHEIG